MHNYLISFGSSGYERGLQSLAASAEPFFDYMYLYTPANIESIFWNQNRKIMSQPRGFGYWLWKPYLIQKTFEIMDDNDLLFYSDALACFNRDPRDLLDSIDDAMILGQNHKNSVYTKGDCFHLLEATDTKYLNGQHANAAFIAFRKTSWSQIFVNEWLHYCMNEQALTDVPNVYRDNEEDFKDHRHDQSILSLMALKLGYNMMPGISQWESDNPIMNHHRTR